MPFLAFALFMFACALAMLVGVVLRVLFHQCPICKSRRCLARRDHWTRSKEEENDGVR